MTFASNIVLLSKNIRFWIILFFIFRLYGITNAPLEGGSTWRQCDGLMIARNFYEHNLNIFYPTVDVAGDKTGIVGSEFPIYNYLIYLISVPFGFANWYGRLINLVLSSLALLYFYKLIKRYLGEHPAFNASVILLVSQWFAYSRVTIPDIFSASLCLMAVYFAFLFLDEGKGKHFIVFFIFALFGSLAKISAATILTVLAIPMLNSMVPLKRKIWLTSAAGGILIGVCFWYFYWVPHINQKFGFPNHFFMGHSFSDGLKVLSENWREALKKLYDTPLKYTGFVAFLIGIFITIRKKKWIPFAAFLVPFMAFLGIMLFSATGLIINTYYPLIAIPSMAFIGGYGLSLVKNQKWAYFLLFIVAVEGILNQLHMFGGQPLRAYTKLEAMLETAGSKRNDLIAINAEDVDDPTLMFFAHRKGWNLSTTKLQDEEQLNYLRNHNCKYIVIHKNASESKVELPLEKIYDSDTFRIYKL
jgi:hypothetical protein